MPARFRTLLFVAPLPFLAACSQLQASYDEAEAGMGKSMAQQNARTIRPGLESLYLNRQPEALEDMPTAPIAPRPEALPFPQGRLDLQQAETLLAGDPMALRFLTIKGLAAQGLLPVDDAARRRDANLGALLPLTTPQPPASGLNAPIPGTSVLIGEIVDLATDTARGTRVSREAKRDFLVERVLPAAPLARQSWSPHDIASARKLQERLGRLEDSGLITPEQRAAETKALDTLIASGTLPENAIPAPQPIATPEPPKPAKKTAATGSGRVTRMPGGVSGQLVVIPSPSEVEPPKLTAATTQAGVFLLAMGTASHGDRAWTSLQKEHAELASLGHTVSRADLGDLGVTYRLIAGPMAPADAENLCTTLKPRGQTCTPTPFPAP